MTVQRQTRNATLDDLAKLLQDQQAAKLDVVVPASAIRSIDGTWHVDGTDAELIDDPEDGPIMATRPAPFVPTVQADEQVANALKIPVPYMRRMRAERPDLYDANVNGWLHGTRNDDANLGAGLCLTCGAPEGQAHDPTCGAGANVVGPDGRSFLVRTFRGAEGPGVARALLSPRYKAIDHLDVLIATLDGVRQAGVKVDIQGCDLSDRRMYVRLVAPEVEALAPVLLRGYRSPFGGGDNGEGLPIINAGLVVRNSETGGGAASIAPRMLVRICSNGMTREVDAIRAVHLGAKLEAGLVEWSSETQERSLALITSQATDAVKAFLSVDYMERTIAALEERAATTFDDSAKAVEVVTTRLGISEARAASVLDHFIKGGQPTLGGIAHAISSVAQTIDDPDLAAEWEGLSVAALDVAVAV